MKEARTPARSHRATAASSSEPCAWLVSGSRPPTKPIAVTMTSHVAMPPREAAAREASPTWPTIAVSTTPIAINPSSIENTASVCDRDASLEAGAEAEAEADASEREGGGCPEVGGEGPGVAVGRRERGGDAADPATAGTRPRGTRSRARERAGEANASRCPPENLASRRRRRTPDRRERTGRGRGRYARATRAGDRPRPRPRKAPRARTARPSPRGECAGGSRRRRSQTASKKTKVLIL